MKKYKHYQDAHHTAKNLISLLIVVLAFGMFLVFYNYGDKILLDGNVNLLLTLAVLGAGLLLGLLYLVNQTHPQKTVAHHPAKKAKAKKKR